MKTLTFEWQYQGHKYDAIVKLDGTAQSWAAEAQITGHPSLASLRINYRLGDFLTPMFISENEMHLFASLLEKVADYAEQFLPETIEDNFTGLFNA